VLLGRVTLADGSAPREATVEVTWQESVGLAIGSTGNVATREARRTGHVDDGRFKVCGVKRDRTLQIKVARAGGEPTIVPVRVPKDRDHQTVTIRLP
jgi:hypothetical protein